MMDGKPRKKVSPFACNLLCALFVATPCLVAIWHSFLSCCGPCLCSYSK